MQLTGEYRYGRRGKDNHAAERTARRDARTQQLLERLSWLAEHAPTLSLQLAATVHLLDRLEGRLRERTISITASTEAEAIELASMSDAELQDEMRKLDKQLGDYDGRRSTD